MSAIADRIRSVIEARGTSARAVSLAAGLSHNTVWSTLAKLDANADARVEDRTLDKIAEALKVDPTWLRTGKGEMDGGAQSPAPELSGLDHASAARYQNLPQWSALLKAARSLEPTLPEWAWRKVGAAAPVIVSAPTPASIAELARYILRHESPPQ